MHTTATLGCTAAMVPVPCLQDVCAYKNACDARTPQVLVPLHRGEHAARPTGALQRGQLVQEPLSLLQRHDAGGEVDVAAPLAEDAGQLRLLLPLPHAQGPVRPQLRLLLRPRGRTLPLRAGAAVLVVQVRLSRPVRGEHERFAGLHDRESSLVM